MAITVKTATHDIVLPSGSRKIMPQPGSQTAFLTSQANITIGGGGAGGGKTMALLIQPLRHVHRENFGAVIFRREYPQITAPGALWDQSYALYKHAGARPRRGYHDWIFPSGSKIRFAHMQHEDDRYSWDGSEIPLIMFDQAESFTWKQISYMFSRNRSTCGVKPYIRMTCNPDPDCWLRDFLRWWIDDDSGVAIPDRSGAIRYFVNENNEIHWADTAAELIKQFGPESEPRSVTFIPSSVWDNKILLDKNPSYLASLKAMPYVERMRLLGCNWNIRDAAGTIFKREWFEIVDSAPAATREVRYWDRASTDEKKAKKGASHTAGVRMRKSQNGIYYITDVQRFQATPGKVQDNIKNIASQDGSSIPVVLEQDPGQAGVAEVQAVIKYLAKYNARANTVREAKGVRAKPLSAQAEAGNVKIVRAPWNEKYLHEMENFDGTASCVSDQVDASSGAFYMLNNEKRAGVW